MLGMQDPGHIYFSVHARWANDRLSVPMWYIFLNFLVHRSTLWFVSLTTDRYLQHARLFV